jgi:hypothetical protein
VKRYIYLGLLFFMLLFIVFPPAISAGDPTSTPKPYDYLEQNEKTYVDNVRSQVSVIKGKIDSARTDLQTVFLQDYREWYASISNKLIEVNSAISALKQINPPDSFKSISTECQAIGSVSAAGGEGEQLFGDLVAKAQAIASLESQLNGIEKKLNNLLSSIDSKIQGIAEEKEGLEKLLARLLESCMSRPAKPY